MEISQSDIYWMLFIAGGFGVAEFVLWKLNGQPGTLTAFLRKLLGFEPKKPWRPVGIVIVGTFCVWVFLHLVFGIF